MKCSFLLIFFLLTGCTDKCKNVSFCNPQSDKISANVVVAIHESGGLFVQVNKNHKLKLGSRVIIDRNGKPIAYGMVRSVIDEEHLFIALFNVPEIEPKVGDQMSTESIAQ